MNQILTQLLAAPSGLTRVELEARQSLRGQPLYRVLKRLEAQGLIRGEGNTRVRRYFAVATSTAVSPDDIALSPEALEALKLVRAPLTARQPVGYQRAFLDAYVPGKTSYLAPPTRARLAALGDTGETNAPAGTWARKTLERVLLELSWGSSSLEGNTYSLLDTERLFKSGQSAEGKTVLETQMLLNHKRAIEFLIEAPTLDGRSLKSLHALLMENLLADPHDEGRLRSTEVRISGSTYVPLANPAVLEECFLQVVEAARRIDDAFECALFLLVQLPYLQPFIDGNKRCARLAANVPFLMRNLAPLTFVDVPRELFSLAQLAVYEFNRVEPLADLFVWAYERSVRRLGVVRGALGEPDPFRLKYREQLRAAVSEVIRALVPDGQQREVLARFADAQIPLEERPRFVAAAQRELSAVSDATFSRYGLRPSEFEAWRRRS